MAHVLTCTNQKGGVAKTTTNWAVANELRARGYRTLMVDLDPQCNLTMAAGADHPVATVKDVFDGSVRPAEAVLRTKGQGDVIASTLALASADVTYTSLGREQMLRKALSELEGEYDFVLIDTPPSLGILTLNALTAAQHVIIPIGIDGFSFQALAQLSETIQAVVEYSNPALGVMGIVVTNYVGRSNYDQQNLAFVHSNTLRLGVPVFDTVVTQASAVKEAVAKATPLQEYRPGCKPAQQYSALTDEILGRFDNE